VSNLEDPRTIGLLADTHSTKADGSDLPDAVLKAFAGCDLIVHLGDIGRKGILDRLEAVGPVLIPFGANKGYFRHGTTDAPVKVLVTHRTSVGLWFNIAQPDKKVAVGAGTLAFDGDVSAIVQRRFKQPVDVVAFAGTHHPLVGNYDDILFVNPGSPTLPEAGTAPSVAIIDIGDKRPTARVVEV
jgi:uncharacterized protein